MCRCVVGGRKCVYVWMMLFVVGCVCDEWRCDVKIVVIDGMGILRGVEEELFEVFVEVVVFRGIGLLMVGGIGYNVREKVL